MESDMTTTTYRVEGMTCGHCVAAVTEEILKVDGVRDVSIDLVTDAPSTVIVTSDADLDLDAISGAVDEAGYTLMGTSP